ncbi:MAG: DNA repair and recombination protein RadB [Thermoplasmatales archaeon SG8-52-3]|nr:MAG: DNA repair and recombination protein RadB [Thermoplasmatales archaeon SG8-52-3]
MNHLKINCQPLDVLLGGGIESKSITEIYGEPGSGKTNFCLQAARECAANGKIVAYIVSNGLSLERLNQLCNDIDSKKIFSKILFFKPSSLNQQEEMINNAMKIKNLGLIILDTFNLLYRLTLESDEKFADRSLNRQITDLQVAARRKNIFVIISGQVYSTKNDDVKPFAGKGIQRIVKTILKLEKIGIGKRQATIIKHPSQEIGRKAVFKITSKGLE